MNPIEFRPFTPEELHTLQGLASQRSERRQAILTTSLLFLLLISFGAVGLRILSGPLSAAELAVLAVLAAAGALAILVAALRKTGPTFAQWRAAYAADLLGGRATTETFEVLDAIQVAEIEDEGSNYLLKLGDGRVLFLSGQYLYGPEDGGSFPSTRVAITRAPRSRLVLDVRCLGTSLGTSSRRAPFTEEEHRAGAVPEDGAILQVDFESLRGEAG